MYVASNFGIKLTDFDHGRRYFALRGNNNAIVSDNTLEYYHKQKNCIFLTLTISNLQLVSSIKPTDWILLGKRKGS